MTRSLADVQLVVDLFGRGESKKGISRLTGIPRATVRDWLRAPDWALARSSTNGVDHDRRSCSLIAQLPERPYAYLLGLYLGDGTVSQGHRGVYRLRIVCCDAYPHLMDLCEEAMSHVMPGNRVGRVKSIGCTEVGASSKHWPCLFPQYGPGLKHTRSIVLAEWQERIAEAHPDQVVRGLIHSDGCVATNRVKGRNGYYEYSRYFFSQRSTDIIGIFTRCCDLLGVEWRMNRPNSVSVAKRASVAILDSFIERKS